MKQASVRDVQHNLRKVLQYLEHGDEIVILKRNRPIAKIVPYSGDTAPAALPDFTKRRERFLPQKEPAALSGIILEGRGE